jgi:hypothetical protein
MLDAQADAGSEMTPLIEQALLGIYRTQQEHAWSKSAVEDVETALEKAGLHSRLHRPPAVCFLDITGYTRLTEERGDEAAADLAARVATLVRRSSREHGGQVVKWLGDGVMFYSRTQAKPCLPPWTWWRGWPTNPSRPRASGSRPDRWSSRKATTSVGR